MLPGHLINLTYLVAFYFTQSSAVAWKIGLLYDLVSSFVSSSLPLLLRNFVHRLDKDLSHLIKSFPSTRV